MKTADTAMAQAAGTQTHGYTPPAANVTHAKMTATNVAPGG
jgi:hypothetical protein